MSGLNLKLSEVAKAAGVRSESEWSKIRLGGVSTDSRNVAPGDLFVALKGDHFNGHDFLGDAFEKGAEAALISENREPLSGRNCVSVPDTLQALGDLAAYLRSRRRQQPLKVVAVSGSNGKTTTKEMLVRILGRKFEILATKGNFNNLIGLPLTLFSLKPEHEVAVLEMGMNQPGEIGILTSIAEPAVGVLTNIAPAHLEGLGSLEGVAEAKGELYAGLPEKAVAVVNIDDELVVEQADKFPGAKITFGFAREAMVRVEGQPAMGLTGTRFTLVTPDGKANVKLGLLGIHNVANALAAAASATALGATLDEIRGGLEDMQAFPGRLEMKKLSGPVYLLDDTYNSNPASVAAAFKVMRTVGRGKGRWIAVLGDMLELGESSRFEHDLLGRAAAAMKLDLLAAVGPESKAIVRAAKKHGLSPRRVAWFADSASAGEWVRERMRTNDRILVKGSRGMRMERAVDQLLGGEEG